MPHSKIDEEKNPNATNYEVFENDLMVDISDLLLIGQVWRVTENIHRNIKDGKTGYMIERIDQKIECPCQED